MRRVFVVALIVLAGAAAAGAVYMRVLREETISIRVRGFEEDVRKGTTVAEAAEEFDLRPIRGNLLDVHGEVLRGGAFPGRLELNGRRARRVAQLREGDRLDVVHGRNQREPLERLRVEIPGGEPSNPQFTLARTPGTQEFIRGRISRKLASVVFHPTGVAEVPRAVALTFDDGPSEYTRQVLVVLHRLRARATFFVVGDLAERRPDLVRRELAAGMRVASHSYSHPFRPPFGRLPHERIREEIERGGAALSELGAKVTAFRPPGGSFSPYVLEAAGSYGQRIVLWSVDPQDWRPGLAAKKLTRRVLDSVHPGSIVLLHDGGGDQSATVKALPAIVKGIRKKGLRLVLVDGGRGG